MEGEMMNGGENGRCKCPHHKATGFLLLLIALSFLLKALGVLDSGFVDIAWPVLLGLIALKKMSKGICKCYANHSCKC